MNGPKVRDTLALVKLNYMRETPQKLSDTRLLLTGSKNSADRGTIRREDPDAPGTLRDFTFRSVR